VPRLDLGRDSRGDAGALSPQIGHGEVEAVTESDRVFSFLLTDAHRQIVFVEDRIPLAVEVGDAAVALGTEAIGLPFDATLGAALEERLHGDEIDRQPDRPGDGAERGLGVVLVGRRAALAGTGNRRGQGRRRLAHSSSPGSA
jgi:hypothetical protein